jgi:hypothetical protein
MAAANYATPTRRWRGRPPPGILGRSWPRAALWLRRLRLLPQARHSQQRDDRCPLTVVASTISKGGCLRPVSSPSPVSRSWTVRNASRWGDGNCKDVLKSPPTMTDISVAGGVENRRQVGDCAVQGCMRVTRLGALGQPAVIPQGVHRCDDDRAVVHCHDTNGVRTLLRYVQRLDPILIGRRSKVSIPDGNCAAPPARWSREAPPSLAVDADRTRPGRRTC